MLVLSNADIHAVLDPGECEAAMVDALRAHAEGRSYFPLRTVVTPPGAGGFIGLMPAHGDGGFALKTVCIMPANRTRGIDTHQGLVTLFDGDTGMPTAALNAAAITEIRTAAVTAAATRALATADSHVLGVLGSGVQGRAHLRALREVRPWSEIRVYSPTPGRAQGLVHEAELADIGARAVSSAREAVEGADVVVCVTNAREPVLEHAWLAPRAHVNAVGASSLNATELPVQTVAAAALYCDSRESLRHEALEFRLAVEQGAIDGDHHVRGELGELFAGQVGGRTDADGITLFRSLGVGVEDLAAAQLTVARALERGIGTEVAL